MAENWEVTDNKIAFLYFPFRHEQNRSVNMDIGTHKMVTNTAFKSAVRMELTFPNINFAKNNVYGNRM